MKTIKLKPAEGFSVKKPDGSVLKTEGEEVEKSSYWARRVRFGEVELVDGSKNKPVAEKIETKKEEKKEEGPKEKKGFFNNKKADEADSKEG